MSGHMNIPAFYEAYGKPPSGYINMEPEHLAKDSRVPVTMAVLTPEFIDTLQDDHGVLTDIVKEAADWLAKGDYLAAGVHLAQRLADNISIHYGQQLIEAARSHAEHVEFQIHQDAGCEYDPDKHDEAA